MSPNAFYSSIKESAEKLVILRDVEWSRYAQIQDEKDEELSLFLELLVLV